MDRAKLLALAKRWDEAAARLDAWTATVTFRLPVTPRARLEAGRLRIRALDDAAALRGCADELRELIEEEGACRS